MAETTDARKRHIRLTIDIEQELTPAQEQALYDQFDHGMDIIITPLARIPVFDDDGEQVDEFELAPLRENGYSSWDVEGIDIADDHMTRIDEIVFAIDSLYQRDGEED